MGGRMRGSLRFGSHHLSSLVKRKGRWKPMSMPTGPYLIRLETESGVEARKITLVR
jgi:hypothetical protein